MPTIHAGNGWKITMYAADHNPPHFHIITPDGEAQIKLSNLVMMRGRISRKAFQAACAWAEQNKAILEDAWLKFHV
jgi:hypothetical protein